MEAKREKGVDHACNNMFR